MAAAPARRDAMAMSNTHAASTSVAPIALGPGEGEARWFLGVLVVIKASRATTGGTVSVLEHHAAQGAGSPLHVHHDDDEWFHALEGELTFWIGGDVVHAPAGSFVFGPRGIPHTFTVSSPAARFLLVTAPAGFDEFVRELSVPATSPTLPPADVVPPAPEVLMDAAARYGLDILGPPGIPA